MWPNTMMFQSGVNKRTLKRSYAARYSVPTEKGPGPLLSRMTKLLRANERHCQLPSVAHGLHLLRARHARFRPIQALLKGYFKSHEHNISLKNIAHYIIICLKRGAETAID